MAWLDPFHKGLAAEDEEGENKLEDMSVNGLDNKFANHDEPLDDHTRKKPSLPHRFRRQPKRRRTQTTSESMQVSSQRSAAHQSKRL